MTPVRISTFGLCIAAMTAMAACSDPAPTDRKVALDGKAPAMVQAETPVEAQAPAVVTASLDPAGQAIDAAAFGAPASDTVAAPPADAAAQQRLLIRAQVLLDRAHFSPGVIDGQAGGNLHQAVKAYQSAKGLTVSGELDQATWDSLANADTGPVMTDYVITEADAQGPYLAEVPKEFADQAKLQALSYTSASEMLAERFHMDEKLLNALNPSADFAAAGTRILVAAPRSAGLAAKVARIEVDKGERVLRAYDASDNLLAVYPATVGSSERPAPAGDWAVNTVAPNPTYTYDPARLTFGDTGKGKLTIPTGPNNPVGVAWIDLTKDTYGIHGGPDPNHIGKTDSHGCVRLTNWDVAELSKAVVKGAKVAFVGMERTAASAD